ncbi:uncharacterized protein IL334_005830 [Kwoniella shivajii]|uniref:Uncharacterized protein n=1 Tax=Kwoniella shivajii TaxID=564305 RepID=A0ABZ1D5R6_9TREE|nr:hypothetical protein IL334_005830 [Kwoniella shivajii]
MRVVIFLVALASVYAMPNLVLQQGFTNEVEDPRPAQSDVESNIFDGICPNFDVRCVKDGDWRNPVGKLGSKPFCRKGIRCNQCEESKNTRECNRTFRVECEGDCQAYGPIPF